MNRTERFWKHSSILHGPGHRLLPLTSYPCRPVLSILTFRGTRPRRNIKVTFSGNITNAFYWHFHRLLTLESVRILEFLTFCHDFIVIHSGDLGYRADTLHLKRKYHVKDYIRDVQKHFPINRAVLYGSYAKGTNNEYSGVDVAIFSDSFKNKNRIRVNTFLFSLAQKAIFSQ